jgi:hypothetical protein
LSSEGEDSFRKRSSDVSTNEPARKKARTDPGPSHAVSGSDSEEEIPVVRGRKTTRIADDGNNNDDNAAEPCESESEVSDNAPSTQVGHGDGNVTNRDSVPPRCNLTLGQESSGSQIPRNFVTPFRFFLLFFTSTLVRKIVEETNNYPREQTAGKILSKYSVWHDRTDVVEEEMWALIGAIINMGLIQLPDMKDYWSEDFVCHVPFFSVTFTRKRFFEIFWMLHLETLPKNDNSL